MAIKQRMTPEEARADHRQMLKFMGLNAAFGMFLGLMTAVLLIFFDIGALGTRIAHASNPFLPVFLIAAPLALIFSAAVTASAIWMMPYERRFRAESEKSPDDIGEGDKPE